MTPLKSARTQAIYDAIERRGKATCTQISKDTGIDCDTVRKTAYYMIDKEWLENIHEKDSRNAIYVIRKQSKVPQMFAIMLRTKRWEPGMLRAI